jgi:hypothetical protein
VVAGSAAVEIAIKPDFKKLRREFGWDSLLTGRSSFCGLQRPAETELTLKEFCDRQSLCGMSTSDS